MRCNLSAYRSWGYIVPSWWRNYLLIKAGCYAMKVQEQVNESALRLKMYEALHNLPYEYSYLITLSDPSGMLCQSIVAHQLDTW